MQIILRLLKINRSEGFLNEVVVRQVKKEGSLRYLLVKDKMVKSFLSIFAFLLCREFPHLLKNTRKCVALHKDPLLLGQNLVRGIGRVTSK